MEWTPASGGLAYAPIASPRTWLDVLAGSMETFLAEKKLLSADIMAPLAPSLDSAAALAPASEAASLAWLTLQARAMRLGVADAVQPASLFNSPVVAAARDLATS